MNQRNVQRLDGLYSDAKLSSYLAFVPLLNESDPVKGQAVHF